MIEQNFFASRYTTGAYSARARSLWAAVTENNLSTAQRLLSEIYAPDICVQFLNSVAMKDEASGTDISFDREGNIILARARSRPMVILLVTSGADPFARNRLGEEPDMAAMRHCEAAAAAEIRRQKAWVQDIRISESITRMKLGLIDTP